MIKLLKYYKFTFFREQQMHYLTYRHLLHHICGQNIAFHTFIVLNINPILNLQENGSYQTFWEVLIKILPKMKEQILTVMKIMVVFF